jgi:type VI protein secretion system component VasK
LLPSAAWSGFVGSVGLAALPEPAAPPLLISTIVPVIAIYFARFRQLLFNQTYNSLHSTLTSLPITPGPFTVKAHPQPEITNETITIEGVALKVAGNQQAEKALVWSGSGTASSLSINGTGFGEFDGPWATFHLLDSYTWTGDSSGYHLTWPVKGFGSQQAKIDGKPLVAEFDLDSGNGPLFQRGSLAGLKCPAH